MPYSDFIDQFKHYQYFPWGDDWEQAATAAMVSRDDTKRPKTVKDIIPNRKPIEKQNADRDRENWNILVKAAEAHNRRIEAERGGNHHTSEHAVEP